MFNSLRVLPRNFTARRLAHSAQFQLALNNLKKDLKQSMIDKQNLRKNTIRNILAAIKNKEIDEQGKDLDEYSLHDLLQKLIAQRKESIKQYNENKRPDLAQTEEAEISVIEKYMTALPVASKEELAVKVNDLLEKLMREAPGKLQVGDVFKQIDWSTIPNEWRSSSNKIKGEIVHQIKALK